MSELLEYEMKDPLQGMLSQDAEQNPANWGNERDLVDALIQGLSGDTDFNTQFNGKSFFFQPLIHSFFIKKKNNQ
jgi:hypothetical protein